MSRKCKVDSYALAIILCCNPMLSGLTATYNPIGDDAVYALIDWMKSHKDHYASLNLGQNLFSAQAEEKLLQTARQCTNPYFLMNIYIKI